MHVTVPLPPKKVPGFKLGLVFVGVTGSFVCYVYGLCLFVKEE
jgi:hypothetical protein